jgi:hypothetical protein
MSFNALWVNRFRGSRSDPDSYFHPGRTGFSVPDRMQIPILVLVLAQLHILIRALVLAELQILILLLSRRIARIAVHVRIAILVLTRLQILVFLLVLSQLPIRVVVLAQLQIFALLFLAQRQLLVLLFAEPAVLARAHLPIIVLLTLVGQLQILVLLEPHLVRLVVAQLQIPIRGLARLHLGKTALINVCTWCTSPVRISSMRASRPDLHLINVCIGRRSARHPRQHLAKVTNRDLINLAISSTK